MPFGGKCEKREKTKGNVREKKKVKRKRANKN
jgi:hypothetical protein